MTEFRPSRLEILPSVVKNLLILNGLIFLAQNTIGKSGLVNMEELFGLHHIKSPLFHPWQLITYQFLHADFLHIGMNMFAVYIFGSILENIWGPKRFLTFYLLCGVGAGVIQLVSLWFQYHDLISLFVKVQSSPDTNNILSFYDNFIFKNETGKILELKQYLQANNNSAFHTEILSHISSFTYNAIGGSTIGASGAVFGLLAAFIYLLPDATLYLYFLFPIKAKWIGLFYFGSEIVSALQNKPGDHIAHWAHLGGGLVGFLLVLTWNKKNKTNFY